MSLMENQRLKAIQNCFEKKFVATQVKHNYLQILERNEKVTLHENLIGR